MQVYNTVIFDLGAVLIDWNPDYLYTKLIPSANERAWFYKHICTPDWNEEQDAGRPIQEATEMLVKEHPKYEDLIRAYYGRWEEMLKGPIDGTVQILKELKDKNQHTLIALTNWSAETFPIALKRFEFLHWFHGRVVSGEEKTRKPFTEIYQSLLDRYDVIPEASVFVDDNERNLSPAAALGIKTVHFTSPESFRRDLMLLGIL